ncbi:MAG TPA: glycoside hydrolase family 2 TIM barrel-domain containing protein [Pilimelia sp.]|nr:glycoside hydrolase family 2 TIM barrel-domain containing protein [Pilimelia sp.]
MLGAAGVAASGLTAPEAAAAAGSRSATETLYLSGRDKDRTVDWEFKVDSGRNSGVWSTIPVPANWEFHGFGTYTWGWNLVPEEIGHYRRQFTVPAGWRGKRTYIVFEGSMTDTEVWVNGQSAGAKHQGGFYRFRYDITDLLTYGGDNLLEVTVSKDSTDASINRAERQGDYWNFGGIYRPVYLEAFPAEFIDRLAVDARADGTFSVDAYLGGVTTADTVVAQLRRLNGDPVGAPFAARITPGTTQATLRTTARRPRLWTAETPNLYQVDVRLYAGRREVHRTGTRFGFRTIEVRVGDGVYVNGQKVVLKGANRHVIWPDSGRATSPKISRDDVLLIKEMNMNSVRMSHYPPDTHFLDMCDELGLYVLDELAGWQKPYDEAPAIPLVREMVIRDVNHPSILFWLNGNEGGWQTAVDDDYALYDPQNRTVLHPWNTFGGINTDHYENYESTRNILAGSTIYMSTEFLHALYDGGGGAGLDDYWNLMMSSPMNAGGFIWALVDEGIVRDDRGGAIDVTGNSAPDGLVGPFREKEASFYTVKEIWSPIQVTDLAAFEERFPGGFAGRIPISNHYHFTNTNQCRFDWQLVNFAGPANSRTRPKVISDGRVNAPDIAPGGTGALNLRLPANWRRADALRLTVRDPGGNELYTWVWTIKKAADHARRAVRAGSGRTAAAVAADRITLRAAGTEVAIDATTGRLATVSHRGAAVSLTNGPTLATGSATFAGLTHGRDGAGYFVQADYTGDLSFVRWRMAPSGWLRLEYQYSLTGSHPFFGVNFDYPEANVRGVTWLGDGPYRVWKNRLRGVNTGVWSKEYNDTATGADVWQYPEFKGYHANTYWATLRTSEADITVVAEEEDLYLRLLTPRWGWDPRFTAPPFPAGAISLLDAIPPMGTKFDPPANLGPQGQLNVAAGDYRRTVHLRFGNA